MQAFRDAVESGDIEAAVALLADDGLITEFVVMVRPQAPLGEIRHSTLSGTARSLWTN